MVSFGPDDSLARRREVAEPLRKFSRPPQRQRTPLPASLSALERNVANLIEQDLSNSEIAEQLGISRHDVKEAVSAIIRKCSAEAPQDEEGPGGEDGA